MLPLLSMLSFAVNLSAHYAEQSMFGFARGAAEEAEKETGVKLKSSSPIPKAILASFQQALKEQVPSTNCQVFS